MKYLNYAKIRLERSAEKFGIGFGLFTFFDITLKLIGSYLFDSRNVNVGKAIFSIRNNLKSKLDVEGSPSSQQVQK